MQVPPSPNPPFMFGKIDSISIPVAKTLLPGIPTLGILMLFARLRAALPPPRVEEAALPLALSDFLVVLEGADILTFFSSFC